MNLRTSYMGLDLDHPVVASPGPFSRDIDGVLRLEDGGAAAVVLASLFEEQIKAERDAAHALLEHGSEAFAESQSFFPDVPDFEVGPERYLELVRKARERARVPVIASLNGASLGGWVEHARMLEQAGASALELNLHFVPTGEESGAEVEARCLEIVQAVRAQITIPLAVKVGPFFSAWGHMARALSQAGANGLVLFNRFYEPDLDIDRREVVPHLELSSPSEMRLGLLWLSVLYGRIGASLAGSTGVDTPAHVVKYLMAGADIVMTTSAVLRHGPGHLRTLREGLRDWLSARGYSDIAQLRGSMSRGKVADPSAFERASYVQSIEAFKSAARGR